MPLVPKSWVGDAFNAEVAERPVRVSADVQRRVVPVSVAQGSLDLWDLLGSRGIMRQSVRGVSASVALLVQEQDPKENVAGL